MTKYPLISIVTINYKQAQVTNALLESLQKVSWPHLEIIVVDNNSGEESWKQINTQYENVVLFKASKNYGFAGGNNIGMRMCNGEYILLLNNDTEVEADFLNPLVAVFQNQSPDKPIGAVCPMIKYHAQPELIQYAGYSPMSSITQRMHAIGNKEVDNGQFGISETNYAHGCAMMVPRQVIEQVGFMPPHYFLYYEELEWSTKIKKSGFAIYVEPKSIVYHKESVSVEKNSPLKTYYLTRNRILFLQRNFNYLSYIAAMCYLVFISFPLNFFKYVLTKSPKHLQAYTNAWAWHFISKNYTFKT